MPTCGGQKTPAQALKAGQIGFLTEPFNEKRLIENIRAALVGRRMATVER
jgi:FixJ family two-component response regulator